MVSNLLKNCKIKQIQNGSAAAQTTVTSSTFAMDGFNAVTIIASLGTVTDGSVLQLNVQEGAAANGSDAATISGAQTPSATAATSSNTLLVAEALRIVKEYVTVTLTRTTQNAGVNCIIAILHQAANIPVTLDASVLASVLESGN